MAYSHSKSNRSGKRAGKRASVPATDIQELTNRAQGTIVYLAEKHSIALALADALPGRTVKKGGYIERGEALITWLSGHLLEQAPPETYDPAFKTWSLNTLPIVPAEFQLLPRTDRGVPQQLAVIKALLKLCPVAVNAADFDREGQLLVDEVLELFQYHGKVLRLQTRALDATSLRRELKRMRPNTEFAGLRDAARARSQLDWLAGINLTRAMTLHGRSQGAAGLLSLGRVQTPTLALVVERDLAIEQFEPRPFYKLECPFTAEQGVIATQLVVTAGMPGADAEKRLVDKAEAVRIQSLVSGKTGQVQDFEKKLVKEAAPLPYNLTELQKEASARYGMGAQATLAAAQALYEAKYTSYPRTDCQYLPMEQFTEAGDVLQAVAQFGDFADMVQACDTSRKSAAWNTGKVSAHHAIIPTSVPARSLGEREARIYALICRRYAWQFLPEHVFYRSRIDITCEDTLWRASGRQEVSPGWTAFKGKKPADGKRLGDEKTSHDAREKDIVLPEVSKGEEVTAGEVTVTESMTTPPARFTEGTLVDAMENIQRYVRGASADDQSILKKTEGLGTVATRASIIETLFDRHYLEKHGKTLQSTALGRDLIRNSPQIIKDPLMTAEMERCLSEIQGGRLDPKGYVADYAATLPTVIKEIFATSGGFAAGKETLCPECGKKLRRARTKKGQWYWVCKGAPECRYTCRDQNGMPAPDGRRKKSDGARETDGGGGQCPRCGKSLVLRKGARGQFWGCTGYPSCRYTASCEQGNSAGETMPAQPETALPDSSAAFSTAETAAAHTARSQAVTGQRATPAAGKEHSAGGSAAEVLPPAEAGQMPESSSRHAGRAASEAGGHATQAAPLPEHYLCPRCGKTLILRKGPYRSFWGCSSFPRCRYTVEDKDGVPALDQSLPEVDGTSGTNREQDSVPVSDADPNRRRGAAAVAAGRTSDAVISTSSTSAETSAPAGPAHVVETVPWDETGDEMFATSVSGQQTSETLASPARVVFAHAAADRPAALSVSHVCPRCGKQLVQRTGPRGSFWGCAAFPRCFFSCGDKDGVPDIMGGTRKSRSASEGEKTVSVTMRQSKQRNNPLEDSGVTAPDVTPRSVPWPAETNESLAPSDSSGTQQGQMLDTSSSRAGDKEKSARHTSAAVPAGAGMDLFCGDMDMPGSTSARDARTCSGAAGEEASGETRYRPPAWEHDPEPAIYQDVQLGKTGTRAATSVPAGRESGTRRTDPATSSGSSQPAAASAHISARPAPAQGQLEKTHLPDECLCPRCGREIVFRNGPKGPFWACAGYPQCQFRVEDKKAGQTPGSAAPAARNASVKSEPDWRELNLTPPTNKADMEEFWPEQFLCPNCGQSLVMRVGYRGAFWGCLNFPRCRYTRAATEAETAEYIWGRSARTSPFGSEQRGQRVQERQPRLQRHKPSAARGGMTSSAAVSTPSTQGKQTSASPASTPSVTPEMPAMSDEERLGYEQWVDEASRMDVI